MKITTHEENGITASIVTREKERLVVLSLSACVQRPWNAHEEAVRLVYTEALLSGAGTLDRKVFLDTLSTHGISLNTSQSGGVFSVSLAAIDQTAPVGLKLFRSVFENPHFAPRELRRIKEYLRNTLKVSKENARLRAFTAFSNALTIPESPDFAHEIDAIIHELGTVTSKELSGLHASLLQSFWKVTIGSRADISKKILETIQILRRHSQYVASELHITYDTKQLQGRRVLLTEIPSKHNIEFSIGGSLSITRNDPVFPAFSFGMSVLGLYGGFTGRLMSIVREKEGLTYTIYAQAERSTVSQTGFWRIMTFFNPKDVHSGISSTIREIERLHKNGITEDELDRFRSILTTRYAMVEDSLQKKVREVHGYILHGHTADSYTAFKKKLLTVSKREINTVLKTHLNPNDIVISGAGPTKDVEKQLKRFEK